jgi:hypothetical protein
MPTHASNETVVMNAATIAGRSILGKVQVNVTNAACSIHSIARRYSGPSHPDFRSGVSVWPTKRIRHAGRAATICR